MLASNFQSAGIKDVSQYARREIVNKILVNWIQQYISLDHPLYQIVLFYGCKNEMMYENL